mmetsp:Transcript_6744/g.15651  ORF Transcript_6744/g.15651 Transcript_6744/m.15651 type:complete len:441 (-) Transcript_6744:2-1324(-)
MADSADEVCIGCALRSLEVSLVLVCNHRLCLWCARRELETSEWKVARCPSCASVTPVDSQAAEQIREYAQPAPRIRDSLQRELDLPKSFADRSHVAQVPDSGLRLTPPSRGLYGQSPVTKLLPKPTSPQPSAQIWPIAGSEAMCGQCQASIADVRCCQCDEIFCSKCSERMHRKGRMREHRLVKFRNEVEPNAPISVEACAPISGTVMSPITCPHHPGEALHYFCLSCTECICAECAVHRGAAHYGHDVVNVRVAFQQLSPSIAQALQSASSRLQSSPSRKQAEVQPVEDAFDQMKLEIVRAFEALFCALKSKEDELLAGSQTCGHHVDEELLAKIQQYEAGVAEMDQVQEMLAAVGKEADEVLQLNLYAEAKARLAMLCRSRESSRDDTLDNVSLPGEVVQMEVEELASSLQHQLGDVLAAKTAEVESLAGDLRTACLL